MASEPVSSFFGTSPSGAFCSEDGGLPKPKLSGREAAAQAAKAQAEGPLEALAFRRGTTLLFDVEQQLRRMRRERVQEPSTH